MLASDVARHIVAHYGDAWFLTNLKLNLLVYWCQVGALRDTGAPLFADEIAVGECGRSYRRSGRNTRRSARA